MSKQTWWQRLFLYLLTGFALGWFALSIAQPFVEYRFGSGPLTVLFSELSYVAITGIVVTIVLAAVLRWTGLLPRGPETSVGAARIEWRFSWRFMLVTFLFWIVVTFALVAFFVAAPRWITDQRVMNAFTNVLPITLLVAVWIGLLTSMRWRIRQAQKEDETAPAEKTTP